MTHPPTLRLARTLLGLGLLALGLPGALLAGCTAATAPPSEAIDLGTVTIPFKELQALAVSHVAEDVSEALRLASISTEPEKNLKQVQQWRAIAARERARRMVDSQPSVGTDDPYVSWANAAKKQIPVGGLDPEKGPLLLMYDVFVGESRHYQQVTRAAGFIVPPEAIQLRNTAVEFPGVTSEAEAAYSSASTFGDLENRAGTGNATLTEVASLGLRILTKRVMRARHVLVDAVSAISVLPRSERKTRAVLSYSHSASYWRYGREVASFAKRVAQEYPNSSLAKEWTARYANERDDWKLVYDASEAMRVQTVGDAESALRGALDAWDKAAEAAAKQGILVIISAGNDQEFTGGRRAQNLGLETRGRALAINLLAQPHSVVDVGAAAPEQDWHTVAPYSSPGSVEFIAPGQAPVGEQGVAITGTSFATPAAAAVALRLAHSVPDATPSDISRALVASAATISDPRAGAGLIQPGKALTELRSIVASR